MENIVWFGIWDAEAAVSRFRGFRWRGQAPPESRGCRPTVPCCMVGRNILNSMIDNRGMPYHRTVQVIEVCLTSLPRTFGLHVYVCPYKFGP